MKTNFLFSIYTAYRLSFWLADASTLSDYPYIIFILICNLFQQILMLVKVVVVIFHVFKKDRFLVKTGGLNILL